jgi:hypothetical protein
MRTTLIFLFSLCFALSAGADFYLVTTTSDSGPGSLRQAIADANAHSGFDTIDFNIPISSLSFGISSGSPLVITSPLILDGATQESPAGLVKVIVGFSGTDGFVLDTGADGSEIRNLDIQGATGSDHAAIRIAAASNVKIAGNIVGGTAGALSTNDTGIVISTSANTIGGTTALDRNIIGGNLVGIEIDSGATDNQILGNFIGVDSDGTTRRANLSAGISIENGSGNIIGGTTDPSRNVIDGSPAGIIIFKPSARNIIERNYFGLTAGGNASSELRNTQGIVLGGLSENNVLRNLISNNVTGVVVVEGFNHSIQGNFIGTDAEGLRAIPNGTGIAVANVTDVNELLIGGSFTGESNLISGNTDYGILVESVSVVRIEGNIIGVDAIGNNALGNGTGVRLLASENTILGGPIAASGNVISGNRGDGVYATRATILSNTIGMDLTRKYQVPNGGNGITGVTDGALQIGGLNQGNLISFNNGFGIDISGNANVAARSIEYNIIHFNRLGGIRLRENARQTIRRNSIDFNGGIGIDLGGDGVTPNDTGDGDGGPNLRQNFPVLTSAPISGGTLTVNGTLHSAPNTNFTLDFYHSLRPSTPGSGATWLGSATVRTDASGNALIAAAFNQNIPLHIITATATDPAGNTSEFSNGVFAGPPAPSKRHAVRH